MLSSLLLLCLLVYFFFFLQNYQMYQVSFHWPQLYSVVMVESMR